MEANSRFTRDNIYLLCLDEESEQEIADMGFRCVPVVNKRNYKINFVWKLRIEDLSCLLEACHNVILSDSDALWLKDPEEDLWLAAVASWPPGEIPQRTFDNFGV